MSNWRELPESCRTEFDYPYLLEQEAGHWGRGECSEKDDRLLGMANMTSLLYYIIDRNILQPHELRGLAKQLYDRNKERLKKPFMKKLLNAFFILYDPDIIMVTADSVQGIAEYLDDVKSIQIDEASQLPEYTLLFLLSSFPNANYGLIGDIHQLPPYCEDDLKGKLKQYGIGNTMERAIHEDMFPQATLRYIYRCHPKTTKLLSELFYDGKLLSGVTEDMRNEFMRKRPDFWPNSKFPIMVVDNRHPGYRIGTSCGNDVEKEMVKQLVSLITEVHKGYSLKARDIGVISFYAAQTNILTEALRGSPVKCGTVDAFQGTEREVVILCCTNEKPSEFMQLANRLNVAMSRARQATIIIGSLGGLRKAKYWKTILKEAEANDCVINSTNDAPVANLPNPNRNQSGRGGRGSGRGRGRGRGRGKKPE